MAACRNYTLLTMKLLLGRLAMALNAHEEEDYNTATQSSQVDIELYRYKSGKCSKLSSKLTRITQWQQLKDQHELSVMAMHWRRQGRPKGRAKKIFLVKIEGLSS